MYECSYTHMYVCFAAQRSAAAAGRMMMHKAGERPASQQHMRARLHTRMHPGLLRNPPGRYSRRLAQRLGTTYVCTWQTG